MTAVWWAVAVTGVGCYLLKLLGLSVPRRLLERAWVQRVVDLLPVALLAALVATQVFAGSGADGPRLVADARVAGVAAAILALLARAPFLVVVTVAAVTGAVARAYL